MFKLRHWWWWWWYFKLYGSTIFTNIGQSWKTKVNVSVGQSQIMLLAQHSVVFIKKIHLLVYNQTEHKTGEGNGTPLQYSCLENPMERGAWWAAVHGVSKSWTPLSDFTFTFHFHALEKEMATHSSVLAWRVPGTASLVGCHLWGRTESDTTEAT